MKMNPEPFLLAHYEAGSLRVLAGALPTLAEHLGVSVEDLIGTPAAKRSTGKRGPAPRLQQQLEQLSRLPKTQQRPVSQLIDTVLQQHRGQARRNATNDKARESGPCACGSIDLDSNANVL